MNIRERKEEKVQRGGKEKEGEREKGGGGGRKGK